MAKKNLPRPFKTPASGKVQYLSRRYHQQVTTVLGRRYRTWTLALIRAFLFHYGRDAPYGVSKTRLFELMNVLAQDYKLDGSDYDEMYAAYWARRPLPARNQPPPATSRRPKEPLVASNTPSQQAKTPLGAKLRPTDNTGEIHEAQEETLSERDSATGPTATDPSSGSKAKCKACYIELTPENTPQGTITSECAHEADYCHYCITESISVQLKGHTWDHLHCPGCDAGLSDANIREFASPDIVAR